MQAVRYLFMVLVCYGMYPFTSNASIIYNNGGPTENCFDCGLGFYDDFTLEAGNALLSDIHWWGSYDLPPSEVAADDFDITIHISDSPDTIGVAIVLIESAVEKQVTQLVNSDGQVILAYSTIFDPIDLEEYAGDQLWLRIVNNPVDEAGGDIDWGWSETALSGNNSAGRESAFYLTTVPEPTTFALFGIGLAGLGWSRRKRA